MHRFRFFYASTIIALPAFALVPAASGAPPPVTQGLEARFVADDATPLVDGTLDVWSDSSGTSLEASQRTGDRRPLVVSNGLNGHSIVVFDGIDDGLSLSDNLFSSSSLPKTIFAVVRSGDVNGHIIGTGSSSSGYLPSYGNALIVLANNFAYKANAGSSGLLVASNDSTLDGSWQVLSAVVSDGATTLAARCSSTTDASSTNPYGYGASTIGSSGSGVDPFEGDIAEILVYDGELTPAEIASVRSDLANDYGLTLPPTSDTDGDGIYDNCDQDLVYLKAPQVTATLSFPSSLTGGVLANLTDAADPLVADIHTQSSHIWVSGNDLEFELDFNGSFDLHELHFWNYSGEGYDVDTATVTFYDGQGGVISSFEFLPERGQAPIHAEDFRLPPSTGVRTARFLMQGTNSQVDFINVGFSATPSNRPPVALPVTATTTKDVPVTITLRAADPDGDALTLAVETGPTDGVLEGQPPDLSYRPAPGFTGSDAFTFVANDGSITSDPAVVSIEVLNQRPTAFSSSAIATANGPPVSIELRGEDPDGDPLTFEIVAPPSAGGLEGVAPDVRYVPSPDYVGSDQFQFIVDDGELESNTATVTIQVNPSPNQAPTAQPQSVSVRENDELEIRLEGTDPDGDSLEFEIVSPPVSGVLSGSPPEVVYTPNADFVGIDQFDFTVDDGVEESSPAAVDITVLAEATVDAGSPDVPHRPDAGGRPDAGSSSVDPLAEGGGCSCRVDPGHDERGSAGPPLASFLAIMAFGWLGRRRHP